MSRLSPALDAEEPRFSPARPHYQPLVLLLAAAAAGIMADRLCPVSPIGSWAAAAGCLAAWLILRRREGVPAQAVCTVVLLLAVAAAAGAWHHCRWQLFAEDDVGRFARRQWQPTCVEAVVLRAPRKLFHSGYGEESCAIPVRLTALRDGANWRPASGRATLTVSGDFPPPVAGDLLRVFAQFSAPRRADNPGGFDTAAYRRADRVLCRLRAEVPQCVSTSQSAGWNFMRLLDYARRQGDQILRRHLDPRQAELASAVLLGLREDVGSDRTEPFVFTGTVHVLAISGLHVGILAAVLFWLMRNVRVARRWSAVGIAATVLFYALMVEAGPPVVRATILVLVACMAVCLGRRPLGFNTLAAAGLVVLAVNPAELFHVGTQLSFLCVAGLIWLAKQRPHSFDDIDFERHTLQRLIFENLGRLPRFWLQFRRAVIGLALAGVLLWALTLPLIMARFHVCSLSALCMNVVLWPLITLSLLSGFGTLALCVLCPPLGSLCGLVCNQLFYLLEGCVNLAARTPGSYFHVPGPDDWWLWGYYGALGLLVVAPRLLPARHWRAGLFAMWIVAGFIVPLARQNNHRLDCTFLDVGHGLAAVVELPSGQTMLYDCGQLGSPQAAVRTLSNYLWHRGKMHIDAVVLSHADADHYNALPGLLKRFSIGAVYVSPRMLEQAEDGQHGAWTALHWELTQHGIPIKTLAAGDRLSGGDGCRLEVLHPARQTWGLLWSDNAQSLTLAVEYQGRRILLDGDIEPPGLGALLSEASPPCDVLLAPHHGSRMSNSPALAAWSRPRWVVLSGDDSRNREEIDATYHAVGGQVLRTCEQGAVRARITATEIEVSSFLSRCALLPGEHPIETQ